MIKRFTCLLALMGLVFGFVAAKTTSTPSQDSKSALKTTRKAKVYKGPQGETITMVFLEKNELGDVLIKFDDVDGPWNGKVLMHDRKDIGSWGDKRENFTTQVDGGPWNSITVRGELTDKEGQPYPNMEVYVKGGDRSGFHVKYSPSDSKEADASAIINEFRHVHKEIYQPDGKLQKVPAEKVEQANAKAVQLYTAGKLQEAIDTWRQVLNVDPLNEHARQNIMTTLAQLQAQQ